MYEESLGLLRKVGDNWGIAYTLGYQAIATHFQGDFTLACSLAEQSLARFGELGDKQGAAGPLTILGQAKIKLGDHQARVFRLSNTCCHQSQGFRWVRGMAA